ncbi:MAG: right-handed parallel beta-helix repeat-containing protein, partial [Actinobacteria bacterium]|nr:right-handed parallel beta-helix repeat-containing protein [Actinomycetota bacterium]
MQPPSYPCGSKYNNQPYWENETISIPDVKLFDVQLPEIEIALNIKGKISLKMGGGVYSDYAAVLDLFSVYLDPSVETATDVVLDILLEFLNKAIEKMITGDMVYMSGYGNVTIAGEAVCWYAGASRTVVYAGFSQYGTQLTYCWDKQTGVMVEASTTSGTMTGTAKATETNMWEATENGTIYIRADGSIDPPDAPISSIDNVTYTLTGNITSDADGMVVERDNIVVDGAGYTIQGVGSRKGIDLTNRSGITVKNTRITGFDYGIWLSNSSNNMLSYNNASSNNWYGIFLQYSSSNALLGNTASGNINHGIYLYHSSSNTLSGNIALNNSIYGISLYYSPNSFLYGNDASNNSKGIDVHYSSNSTVSNNTVSNNSNSGINLYNSSSSILSINKVSSNGHTGVGLLYSNDSTISANKITNTTYGVWLLESSNNSIYHNNFVDNENQVYDYSSFDPSHPPSINDWDDGYRSGGNYWSDYNGVDVYSGSYQNETGSDGIGDSPYVIDVDNLDRFPLVEPYAPSRAVGVNIGDWGMYEITYNWTGTPPPNHELLNNIERVRVEVKTITGSVIAYHSTMYLKNDTEQILPDSTWDVAPTGSYPLAGIFLFIGANISAGDGLYQPASSLRVNETVIRTYNGEPRETNHFNGSTYYYDADYDMDCFWDKKTGILTEELLKQHNTPEDSYSIELNMTDTNIWGFPVHNLDVGQSYSTIQNAVDATETLEGHTILVDEGIYYEQVTVDKSLRLIGEDRSAPVVDGNGTSVAVTLSGTDITFSGFTVRNT